jgi:AraC-like DNA-binding protein
MDRRMAPPVLGLIPEPLSGLCWLSHAARPRYPRRSSPHRHAEIEINVIETGSCRYLIDGRVQTLSRGDMFWLFPAQPHVIIDASADMSLWVLLARPEFLVERAPMVPLETTAPPQFARPHRLRESDRLHLGGVAAALTACEDTPQHHADGLAWWFAQASRITEAQTGRAGRSLHPAIAKALSLLEADPSLPLPDLARDVHISASRLSHLFVEQLERTVSAHRNHVKLRRFQEQMSAGDCRNLTQAAFDAGFGSYAQFARVLRASTGVTPRTLLGEPAAAAEFAEAAERQPQTIKRQRRAHSAAQRQP